MESEAFQAALIGGLLSASGAALAIFVDHLLQRRREETNAVKKQFSVAFSGQSKLVAFHAWMSSTKSSIDECFTEAGQLGLAALEPMMKVREIVGANYAPARLTSEEIAICISGGDTNLVGQILTHQENLMTAVVILERYNEGRRSFQKRLIEHLPQSADVAAEDSESIPFEKMPTELRIGVGFLNGMLGDLMQSLETEIPRCRQLLTRYQQCAFPEGLPIPKVVF